MCLNQQIQSSLSSEDENAYLLTNRVQQKIISTINRLKNHQPSIYQLSQPIFKDDDFEPEQKQNKFSNKKKQGKFTYKKMMTEQQNMIDHSSQDEESQEQDLPPIKQEQKAKRMFKKAVNIQKQSINHNQSLLLKINKNKKQQKKIVQGQHNNGSQLQRMVQLTWNDKNIDETDLFLKRYILEKKWISQNKFNRSNPDSNEEIKDQQDQERSLEMDEYEANYNFRFEQPGAENIIQFPRYQKQSVRIKPETRKQRRKKIQQRKKQQSNKFIKQAQQKRQILKNKILNKINKQQQILYQNNHDWFFCDDCLKPLEQNQKIFTCQNCQDYILCDQCQQLIIHKHKMLKSKVPKGYGHPQIQKCEKLLQNIPSCKNCHKRIPNHQERYENTEKSYLVSHLCVDCYDQVHLGLQKKYIKVQPQQYNYEKIIQDDPQKIKQLTNTHEIQEMVDQYLKNQFEGVIAGGVKTKFKYIKVKPESYGLSDEQILYGEDKQMNKYVSIKKLAPYQDKSIRLRNSIYNKKIKGIIKSAKFNKKLTAKNSNKIKKHKLVSKNKQRIERAQKRKQKQLKVMNLSNETVQRQHFIGESRLTSYGLSLQKLK